MKISKGCIWLKSLIRLWSWSWNCYEKKEWMPEKYHVRARKVDMKKAKLAQKKENVLAASWWWIWADVWKFTAQVSFKASRELTSLSCFSTNKVEREKKKGQSSKEKNSGDGREENAPLGKVFHCQRSLSSRDLQWKPFCPLRGELTITEQKHGGDFISISKGWMIIVPGAIWQHFPSLQLHRQPIHSCQNSLVQVQFSYHHPGYLWDSEVHNHFIIIHNLNIYHLKM